jgi:hypothetical protein
MPLRARTFLLSSSPGMRTVLAQCIEAVCIRVRASATGENIARIHRRQRKDVDRPSNQHADPSSPPLTTTNARRMFRRMPDQDPSARPIRVLFGCTVECAADVSKLRKLLALQCVMTIDRIMPSGELVRLQEFTVRRILLEFNVACANGLLVRRAELVSHCAAIICSTAALAIGGGIALPSPF